MGITVNIEKLERTIINQEKQTMNWNDIIMAIYYNFYPIAIMAFGCGLFISLVKYEHNRKYNGQRCIWKQKNNQRRYVY